MTRPTRDCYHKCKGEQVRAPNDRYALQLQPQPQFNRRSSVDLIVHRRRIFRAIATIDSTPTAKPTTSEATRRCHSICSWSEVVKPTVGEAMPTTALSEYRHRQSVRL